MDKKQIEQLEDLKVYSETAGGEYIKNISKEVVLNTISVLANSYHEKKYEDLVCLCAKLSANLSMFQLLTGISEQIEAIKELYKEEE